MRQGRDRRANGLPTGVGSLKQDSMDPEKEAAKKYICRELWPFVFRLHFL